MRPPNRPSVEKATNHTLPAALRIVRSNAPVSVNLLMNSGRSMNPECLVPSGKEEPRRWDHRIGSPVFRGGGGGPVQRLFAKGVTLSNERHAVEPHHWITRSEVQTQIQSLTHEHTIEWISVVPRQACQPPHR